MTPPNLLELARAATSGARHAGAADVRAVAYRSREVRLEWRDGRIDRIRENTEQGIHLALYVAGRYSADFTSDVRPEALDTFIRESVAMTRPLAPDRHRHLPDPARYRGMPARDLELYDAATPAVLPEQRVARVQQTEQVVRDLNHGRASLNSVSSSLANYTTQVACVTTNGFEGEERSSATWHAVEVSIDAEGGRKPLGGDYAGARFLGDLPSPQELGRGALERGLAQVGSRQVPTGNYDVIIENRAAPDFSGHMLRAMGGELVQQKQSFLAGKLGEAIAARGLSLTSDPHLPRGLGSTAFDGEGMVTRPLSVIEHGVLKNYFLDTYFASKLEMAPTSSKTGNLVWSPRAQTSTATASWSAPS